MRAKIDLVSILTSQLEVMRDFYRDVLGFSVKLEMENFVEFENDGVRLAISTHTVMARATGEASYNDRPSGHSFELAFPADSGPEVDAMYKEIVDKGAKAVKAPEDMPWGQRTAFFADPDGNIHEIFADLT